MKNPKSCGALALLPALVLTVVSLCSAQGATPPSLAEAVTLRGVRNHMSAFERIANTSGGTRAAGTPGYAASLRYVEGLLRGAGYRVTRQAFGIETSQTLAEMGRIVGPVPMDLGPALMEYSPSTPAGGLEAPLSLPSDALGCSPTDFAAARGTVVLIERGTCTFAQKSQNAAAAGALAALITNTDDTPLYGSLGDIPGTVPTAGLTRSVGERLRVALKRGKTHVRLELRVSYERRPTANLLAEWPGAEARVMLGAHLDSVAAGPGINDNGSGSALILELALRLAETGDAAGTRFAFWGAEELGLLGSRHYVASLSPGEVRALRAYLNFDMVASPNAALFTYGDPSLTTLFQDSLRGRGLTAATTDLGGASDHAPFFEASVPVAGLFSGAGGDKSPGQARAYGGVAHTPYDACYHQACDTYRSTTTPAATQSLDLMADAAADALQALLRE